MTRLRALFVAFGLFIGATAPQRGHAQAIPDSIVGATTAAISYLLEADSLDDVSWPVQLFSAAIPILADYRTTLVCYSSLATAHRGGWPPTLTESRILPVSRLSRTLAYALASR
jgi:hypothetical protein